MKITVCGAAGEVTGSAYLVETGAARVLVDCGMFQGRRATDARNRDLGPIDPTRLDAVVCTHAHLDHTGRFPLLVAGGYRGPIHATPATVDFSMLVLLDAAHIQESDAARLTRRNQRAGRRPVEPLYVRADVEKVRPLWVPLPYGETREVARGVTVRFYDAGHILGSASVEMTVEGQVVVFSGDVGPRGMPFLRDPVTPPRADLCFLESTYGSREHRPLEETVAEFEEILAGALRSSAKVLIPAFAIGRSQVILFYLAELLRGRNLPDVPIYLDSPMAIEATRLYARHRELFDAEATSLTRSGQLQHDLKNLRFLETEQQSRRLNDDPGPAIVIAGAGMCNGGRILHHFKHHLWRPSTAVVLVGYQAEGTLGNQLVRGASQVRIFGERIRVEAHVHTLGGFSAHAGQGELLAWVEPLLPKGPRVALTHGEPEARDALAGLLRERYSVDALRPRRNEVITL